MKRLLLAIAVTLGIGVGTAAFAMPQSTMAASAKSEICGGVGAVSGTGGCAPKAGETTVNSLVSSVITILSIIVGVVSVIMIIVAGFKYVTSGGDSSNVSSAKSTIIYAIVGLVIVAVAQAIVRFVLGQV